MGQLIRIVREVIKALRVGKAIGIDGILNEIWWREDREMGTIVLQ